MSEEFTMIGWKVNEILYYWRGTYWRWTRSPMVKDDPPHVFEELTDEHKEGWIRMKGEAYRRDRYERGLCARCANPRREQFTNCQQCADSDKYRFDEQVNVGLCRQCRAPRDSEKVKCSVCNKNARLSRLKKLGLPQEEVEKASVAIDKHNGFCDCCGVSEPGGRDEWCVDHDEKLKKFRGILCNACNSTVGHALDNPERLRAAAVYLEEKQRAI